MLLQFTTAQTITNHDNGLLQFTIGTLLQITTTIVPIYDRYYNWQQLLLQFRTGIKIHDVVAIHDSTHAVREIKTCVSLIFTLVLQSA